MCSRYQAPGEAIRHHVAIDWEIPLRQYPAERLLAVPEPLAAKPKATKPAVPEQGDLL